MAQNPTGAPVVVTAWHRTLLAAAAVCTVLLISMGGILCVTGSIRDCPDWPGCFGRAVPPLETGPILEYTHRLLAALSGILIISSAITGLVRTPRLRWLSLPPLAATLLAVEVAYFGARVVLSGLSPGWAALDLGSALLVVALMVTCAVFASLYRRSPALVKGLAFRDSFSRLVLATTLLVYLLFVSGVLVAGQNVITACLGWPIYSSASFQMDLASFWNTLRNILSILGIGMILLLLIQSWRGRAGRPETSRYALWVGLVFLVEVLIQILLLVFGNLIGLLVAYTVTAAVFWGLLVALLVRTGMPEKRF
jgi:cytochrome c oxidase assembly protein subunit 15